MWQEIGEQPDVLEGILTDGAGPIRDVARTIRAREPWPVLFLARGSSEHATIYAKYLVETRLGIPTGFLSPSTTTVYGEGPRFGNALVIAVSQSGGSPDLVEALRRARSTGAVTLAITNDHGSPLADAAEFHLDLMAGEERAVTATKTYTAELLTLYCLVEALAGGDFSSARRIPEWAARILERSDQIADLAGLYINARHFVTVARGYNFATALEIALKLMETSYVVAAGFSGAELLHGPIAMLDPDFPVIAVAPEGPGGEAMRPILERLREVGVESLVVGDPAAGQGSVGIPLPNIGPEVLSPLLTILPMQQFVWYLARDRGLDPDEPRGLKKVTRTW